MLRGQAEQSVGRGLSFCLSGLGRLHHKSYAEEHFLGIGRVPSGDETLVLHAAIRGLLILQQAQRRAPEDAEVRITVTSPEATLVLAERHVQAPMTTVLDAPLAPRRGSE
jgi:hypothetical protein